MSKRKVPQEEKFQNQDFDLFAALNAIDKKDYSWFDNLTQEQQRKFIPYMLIHWASAVNDTSEVQQYFVRSIDYHANKYLFNEVIQKHFKLQWLMLCAAAPGIEKSKKYKNFGYHQWIPHIRENISKLKEPAKLKEIVEYFTKIYSKADTNSIKEISEEFVKQQKKKMYIANLYPNLKFQDIELLSDLVTDEQIVEYERELGNS